MTTTAEKQANITIEAAPDGLHIYCEYTGGLSSIPAVIDRLREAGVLELVQTNKHTNGGATTPRAAQRVDPIYDGSGGPVCPVHKKALREGQYGLYCSAKASGDEAQNDKGYCSLRFKD